MIIHDRIRQIQLIGISGHAGVGKDTVADYIRRSYESIYTERFADPLKKACSEAFGLPVEFFNNPDLKEEVNGFWDVSPRMIAQFVGTELFREHIWKLLPSDAQNFWVRRMQGRISGEILLDGDGEYAPGDTVVIPDVRFQNEYDYITSFGGIIIHLTRPGRSGKVGIPSHPSEAGFQFTKPEVTYEVENSGTIFELHDKIDAVLEKSELIFYPTLF